MIFDGWKEQKSISVKGGIDTIMVSYDNAASENRMTRQVFYADMRMSREILMNEWDKRRFLTALEEARELLRTEIYAFCVLDDRIRLLAGGAEVRPRTIRRMLAAAMERYERDAGLRGEAGAVPSDTVIRVNIVRMEDEKDALAAMRYIVSAPAKRLFSFRLGEESGKLLGQACEKYLQSQAGRSFGTLAYYKQF